MNTGTLESTSERSRRTVVLPHRGQTTEVHGVGDESALHTMMRTCVVPVDFSTPSLVALQWAAFLAAARSMRVVVLHAISPSIVMSSDVSLDGRMENVCQRLSNLCQPFTSMDCNIEVVCTVADPVEAIVRESRRVLQPIVVMGNRGLSRIRRVFLGSVADGVERAVGCPVLVVHEDDEPPARFSIEASKVLRAVVGVDFHADSQAALSAFRTIAQSLQHAGYRIEVTLLCALPQAQWIDAAEVPVVKTPDFGAQEQDTTERLRPLAKSLRVDGFAPQIVIEHGDPATRILQCARDSRANLIVVGRHAQHPLSRLLLGSTAERVLHGSRVPVLTARAPEVATSVQQRANEPRQANVKRSQIRARIVT